MNRRGHEIPWELLRRRDDVKRKEKSCEDFEVLLHILHEYVIGQHGQLWRVKCCGCHVCNRYVSHSYVVQTSDFCFMLAEHGRRHIVMSLVEASKLPSEGRAFNVDLCRRRVASHVHEAHSDRSILILGRSSHSRFPHRRVLLPPSCTCSLTVRPGLSHAPIPHLHYH